MIERPRCSVFIAVSVDGYIARTDGGLDWLSLAESAGEDYGYAAFMADVHALVLGRKTYETALGFDAWPYAGKRCVVMTRSLREPLHDVELYGGEPLALVERLGREGVRRVYVDGGTVIRAFLSAGLVDDLTLSVIPIVLGSGIPLFGDGTPERRVTLEASRGYPSGVVQLRYRVANG